MLMLLLSPFAFAHDANKQFAATENQFILLENV